MSSLDSILAQYEKNTYKGNGGDKMTMDERMKKYFTCLLPKNENSGQRRIRILPTKNGESPFVEVWFHEVQIDGKWVKLYDPAKNDNEHSPLNDVYEELIATGKETDKQLAQQYRSRKFYIVKVIDRDAEDDGVKFWRIKHNYKNEGILDKIIPIFRAKGDITDPTKGRDLIIQLVKSKSNKGAEYTSIQTVMQDDASPLHTDEALAKQWIDDEMIWSDVYAKKPIEYLEAVAKGETPRWDSVTQKYVYGEDIATLTEESTVVMGGEDPQAGEEPSGDLPF
jgi:hypothetical protein